MDVGEKMRLKHIKGSEEIVENSKIVIKSPELYKGKWKNVFKNNNKIYIEIGMGKGSFLIKNARKHRNINYIGVEKYPSVLLNAIKTIEEENLTNIKIICVDANNIDNIFDKEISKIYLNFSDPWPKKRHAKRRLSSTEFLKKYDNIFKSEKIIEMKTDNDDLYEYSIESFTNNGYEVIKTDTNYFDKYTTEYEDKFIGLGKNINHIYVVKK